MLNFKLIVTTQEKDLGLAADSSLETSAQQAEAVKNRQMERWDKYNDKKPKVRMEIKPLHVSILIIATNSSQSMNSPACSAECKAQNEELRYLTAAVENREGSLQQGAQDQDRVPAAPPGVCPHPSGDAAQHPPHHTQVHPSFPSGFTSVLSPPRISQ